MRARAQEHWYLDLGNPRESAATRAQFDPAARPLVGALDFLTALTLYSTLIPISLYVSIEIIKYFQVGPVCARNCNSYHAPRAGSQCGTCHMSGASANIVFPLL